MLTSVVLILAGVTAWCVASLALALIVGPIVRRGGRRLPARAPRPAVQLRQPQPVTGPIALPIAN